MTTETEYRDKILQYDWDDLMDLWRAIKIDDTPGWSAGKAFEYLVLRAFQLEGAHVLWPYKVTIGNLTGTEAQGTVEQIDGLVHTSDGLVCLLEFKDRVGNINIESIAKLRNQLLRRPSAAIGVVFSRSGFTRPALLLAQFSAPQAILLWSGDEVEVALENRWFCKGLNTKYRICIARGLADYTISRGVGS